MRKRTSGIYSIINKINNKIYIGESCNCEGRLSTHKSHLKSNKHDNFHLQNAVNKYGIENFEFEILEICDENFRKSQENWWCNMLNTHNKDYGYNLRLTTPDGYKKHSQETKDKISKSNKGKKYNEEFKNKIRKRMLGTIMPEEQRKKISNSLKGKIVSEESKEKMSKARKGFNPIMTIEHRKNMTKGLKKWLNDGNGFQSKKIIDEINGVTYNSVTECLNMTKIGYNSFVRNILGKGRFLNKFKFKYANTNTASDNVSQCI